MKVRANILLMVAGATVSCAPNQSQVHSVADQPTALQIVQPGDALTKAVPNALVSRNGENLGTVRVSPWPNSVAIGIVASGLPVGRHRVTLHSIGRCDPPNFASRGARWQPAVGRYGQADLSDLGFVEIGVNGQIYMTMLALGAKLEDRDSGADLPVLLDQDGAAFLISREDGPAIACAVLKR